MKPFRFLPVLTLLITCLPSAACNGVLETVAPLFTASPSITPPGPTTLPFSTITISPLPPLSPVPLLPSVATSPITLSCDSSTTYCIDAGYFLLDRPIAPPGTVTIDPTYPYGSTQNGTRQPHHGVEFANAGGTPVLVAADGIVIVAGNDIQATAFSPWLDFYGNLVIIEHHLPGVDRPLFTLYAHLSRIDVQIGQNVHSGDEIGEVGASGSATGSHLHFEVRLGKDDYDSNRNPVLWLKPLFDENGNPFGTIVGRFVDEHGNSLHYIGINIQYFPDPGGSQTAAYQVETYAPEETPVQSDDKWHENFVLGDLRAGQYRISLIWNSVLYERSIDVQSGKVTVVSFILK